MYNLINLFLESVYVEGFWGGIGVPYISSESQVEKAIAGYISEGMGIKSLDWTYKNYVKDNYTGIFDDSFDKKLVESIKLIKDYLDVYIEDMRNIDKPDIPSLFACSVAFFRLKNSFLGALACLRLGLFLESIIIQRTILEQIAWMYQVHDYKDDFFKLNPTRSISYLKNVIPEAGRMYKILSDFLHVSPELTKQFVKFDETNGGSLIMFSEKYLNLSMEHILTLVDWYCIIGEVVYKDYIEKFHHINRIDSSLNEYRETLVLRRKVYNILEISC